MKSATAFATIALAGAALASPVPDSVAAAPPAFKIDGVTYGGSGCPQGSINVEYTSQGILPIYFNKQFTASVGSGVAPEEARKFCQLNLSLNYSPGWSYAVYSADYTGYASVDDGVKGTIKSTYYFSGETAESSSSLQINGPFTGKYVKNDDVAVSVWSPCSGSSLFNVRAEVALTPLGTYASGTIATVKETGKFTNSLYIKWKQC
ncbi:unnamed protein product [Periconia digitata]|uniref:Secreted protein n=1 Tax=Periconia digitata TaxID=1303443 RepID=A0A9W4UNP4_9PLEO|nr:unnamed protein product [Periconia digitata]